MQLVTSPLSVARLLWWYGEDDLWPSALQLAPHAVADIGERTVEIWQRRDEPGVWPIYPKGNLALVLAAVEFLEGRLRAPARARRRSTKLMPEPLVASEAERLNDLALQEVGRIVQERAARAHRRQ